MAPVIRSQVRPLQQVETRIFIVGSGGDNGDGAPAGPVQLSPDPRNTLFQQGDGLFAAPKLSSAQW